MWCSLRRAVKSQVRTYEKVSRFYTSIDGYGWTAPVVIFKLVYASDSPGELVKTRIAAPHPEFLVVLGRER